MIYTDTPKYAMAVLNRGKGFRPFLDDTAQIIGQKICIVDEKNIKKALKRNAAVLVKEGYAASFGRSEREAKVAMELLEKACFTYLAGELLGGVKYLPRAEAFLMRKIYLKKYSKNEEGEEKAQTGRVLEGISEEEMKMRELLVEYGNKLCDEGLVSGTWGNLSIRIDDEHMLVTPSGISYDRLTPGDMVKVVISTGEYEGDLKPTSEKVLHGAIYMNRPDVKAIVHTHQTYAGIYAACEKGMDGVDIAKYGIPGSKGLAANTAKGLGKNRGTIMAHHGMCAVGKDLAEAFRNCIEIEEQAKARF